MIANGSQLILLRADDSAILALDLPRRTTFLGKLARNHDSTSIFLRLEGLFALIFDVNGNFRSTTDYVKGIPRIVDIKNVPLAFANERLQSVSATSRIGFPAESDGDGG